MAFNHVYFNLRNILYVINKKEVAEIINSANLYIKEANDIYNPAKEKLSEAAMMLGKTREEILSGNMDNFLKNFLKIKDVIFHESSQFQELLELTQSDMVSIKTLIEQESKDSFMDSTSKEYGEHINDSLIHVLTGYKPFSFSSYSLMDDMVQIPVYSVSSVISAVQSIKAIEEAKTKLAEAETYKKQCEGFLMVVNGIVDRCELISSTLKEVNTKYFSKSVEELEEFVKNKVSITNPDEDFENKKQYTDEEIAIVAKAATLAKLIKTLMDTSVIDKSGQPSDECFQLIEEINDQFKLKDIQENHKRAYNRVKTSIASENSGEYALLGIKYLKVDHLEAIRLLTINADSGNSKAQCILGKCLLVGDGVKVAENISEGIKAKLFMFWENVI